MKNSKKNAATTKKDYQTALMKKATAKKTNATPAVDSESTDNISTTTDTEPVMQKQQPSVKVTPFEQIVTPKVGIQNSTASRQDKSVQTLNRAINAIKKYGDLLRQLDQRGFSIDDAKSLVETEKIGFSIHEMLTNKETFDSIADVVTALNPS